LLTPAILQIAQDIEDLEEQALSPKKALIHGAVRSVDSYSTTDGP